MLTTGGTILGVLVPSGGAYVRGFLGHNVSDIMTIDAAMGICPNFSVLGCFKVKEDEPLDLLLGVFSNWLYVAGVVLINGDINFAIRAVVLSAVMGFFSASELPTFLADLLSLAGGEGVVASVPRRTSWRDKVPVVAGLVGEVSATVVT